MHFIWVDSVTWTAGHAVRERALSTNITLTTMPFRFVYQTADIYALSHSLDSADIYIICSVPKCQF